MSYKIYIFNFKLLAVLLFPVLTSYPVFSENMYNGVQVLVGVVAEEQGIETKMDTLIYNLLVFELGRYGIIIEKAEFLENNSLELILSSESDSGLAVICSYTLINERVLLEIELYDTRTMLVLASNSTGADLDLSFDTAIHTAVSELMNTADEDLSKRVINIDDKVITVDEDENIQEKETETKGGMEAFLSAGLTMGIGESSDILTEPGFSLDICANYWFFTNLGFFGLGGQISANIYPYASPAGSASLIVFPVGINLAWSTSNNRLFSSLLQLGSGPAIAILTFEGAEPLIKIIPYISGGLILSMNFKKWMSLGIKTVAHLYFEDTGVITTLTPSLFVSFRSIN